MKKFFLLFACLLALSFNAFAEEAKPKTEIFVTSWCGYCKKLEGFLKKNNIDYIRHDVETDEVGMEEFSRLGGEGVPLVRVGKKVIHGYDPEAVLRALKN